MTAYPAPPPRWGPWTVLAAKASLPSTRSTSTRRLDSVLLAPYSTPNGQTGGSLHLSACHRLGRTPAQPSITLLCSFGCTMVIHSPSRNPGL